MMVVKLAARNLRRHFRRTLITTIGIALGTALSLFSIGLGDGGHLQMIENGVRIGQGHLTVQRQSYLESPSTAKFLADPEPFLTVLEKHPGIRSVYPRIRGEGMLASAYAAEGVQFQGIDPMREGEADLFRDSLAEGDFLPSSDGAHIYIGQKLADRLKLKVGRKTVLTFQDSAGEITSTLLRVSGIFRSGSSSIDGAICLIPIATLQGALGMGRGVTSLAIYLENPFAQEAVYRELVKSLPAGSAGLYHWQTLQPDLRDYVVLDDVFGYLIYAIILFILAIGVLNTVLMSVMERKREIGILTAIGMGGGSVLRMVLLETALITLIGIAGGLVLGLAVNWYFSVYGLDLTSFSTEGWDLAGTVVDPIMRSKLRPHRVAQLCAAVFLLSVTMGIYPAVKAARTEPVEAMEKP
jgi:ABC-type lipoprotein release transport system permease subunit